ncbi:PiggyBac transposable element-derived protein 2 [Trichinella pseudospiralis]|uniref:PiggyBac transposable element-derived protein 2 n=1 Tax=Trichinella pseudospiralis TaxID=6337 RepID=A0A0V1G1V0_TRIPS|nr:PiggyBac transposable element-derived protein 2 [Trichinella pseudospiralis]
MDFDTIFRETRSGRSVRQIIVLPDADVSEPDTVSEDELDHTFQQSNSSSDDEVIEEDDASTDARRKSYTWRRQPFNPKTEPFTEADEEIPSVLRPIEYFRMYFTAQLLSHIAFETNRKATQSLYSNLATTAAEIEVLIGISGRSVRQIIVLPDADVSEPDTVSEDELDHTFQQSNSSSDDEVIEEDDASTDARRKSYTWHRQPFNPKTEPFTEADEEIPSVLRPIEYFRMYFTAQLLSHIAFETNRKATQSLYSNLATTAAEIEVLIGMLITMGICEMPRYRMYWANQTRMDTIANCMSRNRFETLLRFLHFNDNDKVVMDRNHPDYDRFYKIRPLIESIRKTCLEETPGELQSVDEHIIPYKGRCKMKYYNPRKPDKWGLKDITRTDQTGHWPEMMTTKKRCRVCHRTCQVRCMKFNHTSVYCYRTKLFF